MPTRQVKNSNDPLVFLFFITSDGFSFGNNRTFSKVLAVTHIASSHLWDCDSNKISVKVEFSPFFGNI
jgi:hypothetical protein